MQIVITGATGGLGRNAVDFACQNGLEVVAIGRNVKALAELAQPGVTPYRADLTQVSADDLLTTLRGAHAVWHCAALSAPWGPAAAFHAANVEVSRNLFLAAARAHVPVFVHISTPALYFDFQHQLEISEDFRPARYVNHYARTKAQAEQELRKLALEFPGTRLVILRPRAIFGPYDQVLLPRLQRLLVARKGVLPLPRGGRTVLDLTYAPNVAHAMWLATQRECRSGEAFNITNGEPGPLGDALLQLFQTELGMPFAIRDVPYPAMAAAARMLEGISVLTGKEPALTRYSLGALAYDMTLDISKARDLLGYHPVVSQVEALRQTAAWIRAHG